MGMPRDFKELCALRRGSEIIYKGSRVRCVMMSERETPYSHFMFACFENGLVLFSSVESNGVKTVYPAFSDDQNSAF